jgi:glycosyltransferase involved in cell wall biosynthesis
MSKLVTIGIPVYKRLEYLPNVLGIVAAQDYPNIDLLVSDNGMNGTAVSEIVNRHYPKPYRIRQNASTVSGSSHFNQLIQNAIGEYFIVLADDDEISPNFVSDLVRLLEKHPEASAALAVEETIDLTGKVIRRSKDSVPEILSGPDFVRAVWGTRKYGHEALCTFLAKTEKLLASGGFPDIWAATSDEDLLIIKLCLDNYIAFSPRCAFRKRFYEDSGGYSISLEDLARGIREFLACLDSDQKILAYGTLNPVEWRELRNYLVESSWKTYYYRWLDLYKKRLTYWEWVRAVFYMPFIPDYYRTVGHTLTRSVVSDGLEKLEEHFPLVYKIYRTVHPERSQPRQS